MASTRFEKSLSIKNSKAYFDYQILDTYQAGVVLRGTEIKSVRESKLNLQDAYCQFRNGELYVVNLYIALYTQGTYNNHIARQDRKLLLKKKELQKLEKDFNHTQGLTMVPTRLYVNERGFCKIEVGLARGKKSFDKRDTIKERDIAREQRYDS
jgi:SsrA-binding protein